MSINQLKNSSLPKVCILLTPFQIIQLIRVQKELGLNFDNTIFFVKKSIDYRLILESFKNPHVVVISDYFINRFDIFRQPFKQLGLVRSFFKSFKLQIFNTINKDQKYDVYVGTEKDMFSQVFFIEMRKNNCLNFLIGIDEGLGYYTTPFKKDKYLKFFYKLLSPILVGYKLDYFSVLGTSSWYTHLILRFPDDVHSLNQNVKYISFNNEAKLKFLENKPLDEILIFTYPFSEDENWDLKREEELNESVIKNLSSYTVKLKPHPRENISKFTKIKSNYEFDIIDQKISAENIDLKMYKYVVHFGSSIILDFYEKGFPMERCVTIDLDNFESDFYKKIISKGIVVKFNQLVDLNKL